MQFSFFGALGSILASSGFASFAEDPRSLIMRAAVHGYRQEV